MSQRDEPAGGLQLGHGGRDACRGKRHDGAEMVARLPLYLRSAEDQYALRGRLLHQRVVETKQTCCLDNSNKLHSPEARPMAASGEPARSAWSRSSTSRGRQQDRFLSKKHICEMSGPNIVLGDIGSNGFILTCKSRSFDRTGFDYAKRLTDDFAGVLLCV